MLDLYRKEIEDAFPQDDTIALHARLGRLYYPFKADREDVTKKDLMSFYEKNIAITGDQTEESAVKYYMVLTTNLAIQGRNDLATGTASTNPYDEDWVLAKYDQVISIIDNNVENADEEEAASWEETRSTVDNLLIKAVDVDEDFIVEQFSDIIKNKPNDLEGNKKAVKLFIIAKSTKNPLFLKAVENVFQTEPNAGMAKLVYRDAMRNKNWNKAVEYVNKAIKLDKDPKDKAQYYMHLAKIEAGQGKYSSARSNAMKAAELDSKHTGDAYRTIGNLYMQSYQRCAGGDIVQDAGFAFAAYEAYSKAGYQKGMTNAKAYFPSVSDLFSLTKYKAGNSIKVGCWINRSATIRTK